MILVEYGRGGAGLAVGGRGRAGTHRRDTPSSPTAEEEEAEAGGGNAWEGGQWPALSRRGFYFGYHALRYSGYGKERKPPEEVGNKESGRGSDKRTPYGE